MKKSAKILVTTGIIIVWIILFAVIVGVRQSNGFHTPGFIATILFIATIAAVRAVWKKDKGDKNKQNDV
ncbi:MAG: hypothetical protein J6P44_05000 [Bacteroidales bacterium]|nr:hypothetical protein [Bacteroidales bacterium]